MFGRASITGIGPHSSFMSTPAISVHPFSHVGEAVWTVDMPWSLSGRFRFNCGKDFYWHMTSDPGRIRWKQFSVKSAQVHRNGDEHESCKFMCSVA